MYYARRVSPSLSPVVRLRASVRLWIQIRIRISALAFAASAVCRSASSTRRGSRCRADARHYHSRRELMMMPWRQNTCAINWIRLTCERDGVPLSARKYDIIIRGMESCSTLLPFCSVACCLGGLGVHTHILCLQYIGTHLWARIWRELCIRYGICIVKRWFDRMRRDAIFR